MAGSSATSTTVPIHTPEHGLTCGWHEVPTDEGMLPVYAAWPEQSGAGRALPVVLVVQEIFGVHEHICDVVRRLAHAGYRACAPELFVRLGEPRRIHDIQTLVRDIVARSPDARVLADLDATLDWVLAAGGDPQRVGITGFCWGGRIAWLYAAREQRLKAAVAWYGRLIAEPSTTCPRHPLDVVDELRCPVLGLYGGQDQGIPMGSIQAMQEQLRTRAPHSEIHCYVRAPHAFFADYRPSYRPELATDAWGRMLGWLVRNGVA